jgi:hypothetical protein
MQEYVREAGQPQTKQFMEASLGNAQAAIEFFSQSGYADIPEYRERLRDAKKKLRAEDGGRRRSLPSVANGSP